MQKKYHYMRPNRKIGKGCSGKTNVGFNKRKELNRVGSIIEEEEEVSKVAYGYNSFSGVIYSYDLGIIQQRAMENDGEYDSDKVITFRKMKSAGNMPLVVQMDWPEYNVHVLVYRRVQEETIKDEDGNDFKSYYDICIIYDPDTGEWFYDYFDFNYTKIFDILEQEESCQHFSLTKKVS